MAEFCQDLSAKAVDARLKQSLEALRLAEKNAVLWFAEVMRRKLYRDLGYSSIQQYAELELGFKKARTSQFIRLSQALRELPKLRESVANGMVSWTKARELSGVATRKTESAWIAEAQKSTSRELERKVAITKQQARAERSGAAAQAEMLGLTASPAGSTPAVGTDGPSRSLEAEENVVRSGPPELAPSAAFEPPSEVPSDIHYRLSPTQLARYEALMEKLRKLGVQGSREELMLECMEIAVEMRASSRKVNRELDDNAFPRGNPASAGPGHSVGNMGNQGQTAGSPGGTPKSPGGTLKSPGGTPKSPGGTSKSPYQVTVWMCERCGTGTTETGRGPRKLAPATLKAILCDAMVRKPGKRNRSALPERIRRQVMERDRMRCRGAGCNRTRFLAVHHLHPKAVGGPHDPNNLVTLCEGCHQAAHRHTGPPSLRSAPPRNSPSDNAPLRNVPPRNALEKVGGDRDLVRDRSGSYAVVLVREGPLVFAVAVT